MKKTIKKLAQVKIMNIISQDDEGYDELDNLYNQAKDIYNDGMIELVDNHTPIQVYQTNTRMTFRTSQTKAIRDMALYNFASYHEKNKPLRKELSKSSQVKLDITMDDVEFTDHGAVVQQMPEIELHFDNNISDVYSVRLKQENKYYYNLVLDASVDLSSIDDFAMILPEKDALVVIDGASKRKLHINHNGKPKNIPTEVIRAIGARLERNRIIIADSQPQNFSRRIMSSCERPLPVGVSLNRSKFDGDSESLYYHICKRLELKANNIEEYETKEMSFDDEDVSIRTIRDIIEYYAKE